jgi:murein DD-endopeptidase MepM/ murein hydrolase activator NlpD
MRVPVRLRLAHAAILSMIAVLARAESVPVAIGAAAAFGHDDSYVYRLPYGDAVSYAILQAYGSSLSHRGAEYFTVDFGMPEGTPVFSAREGTVLAIEDRFDFACWTDGCDRFANFVEVRHPDGTIGKYFHLQRDSVLVRPGQRVERGQAIARSGDTGYSTAPHLHFGVYRVDAGGRAQSIAVRFAVRGGLIGMPRNGARYVNAADE